MRQRERGREEDGEREKRNEERKRRNRAVTLCMRNAHYFLPATASSSESTFRESRTPSVKQKQLREGFPPVRIGNLSRDR